MTLISEMPKANGIWQVLFIGKLSFSLVDESHKYKIYIDIHNKQTN